MRLMPKLLWFFKPFVKWVDKTFTFKIATKIVDFNYYYLYRDIINKGDVFLTSAKGQGSNLINPSDINHGAIYFGKGLRTAILKLIDELVLSDINDPNLIIKKKIDRLHETLVKFKVNDEICYVIEAVGVGVIPTNLGLFMTTKDRMVSFDPLFATNEQKEEAADMAVHELGKPYDYGFTEDVENRYCFEVPAVSYESVVPNLRLKRHDFKILWKVVHNSFLASTYIDDNKNWRVIFDIKERFTYHNL